jgi:hypothetical protein
MAGFIVFKSGDWGVAGQAYRDMVVGVVNFLPDTVVGLAVGESLVHSVETGLFFLNAVKSFDLTMIREFKDAVDKHIAVEEAVDPLKTAWPEGHQGYVSRLKELQELLATELDLAL